MDADVLDARAVCDRYPTIFKYNTLTYWRQVGRGPNWARLGRKVYYRVDDIEDWIASQFNDKVPAELQLDEDRKQELGEATAASQSTEDLWIEKWLAVAPPMTDQQKTQITRILAGAR